MFIRRIQSYEVHSFSRERRNAKRITKLRKSKRHAIAEFLHQRLQQEQFAVQMVSSGAEAEKLASDEAYDLVLLDLNLPGAGRLDVLRGIRSKQPDLPVVVVTNSSLVEECVHGLDGGADDYVAKPFAFAELVARIRAVLRRGSRPALDSPDRGPRSRPRQPHRAPRKPQH